MKMWALISDDWQFGVRFQQDDLPFGGTFMANELLKEMQEKEPDKNWHLELQEK